MDIETHKKTILEQLQEASRKIREATRRVSANVVWMTEDTAKRLAKSAADVENEKRKHEIEKILNN